jgi:DNA-directed RNA polymerase specialized sigma24 family protein
MLKEANQLISEQDYASLMAKIGKFNRSYLKQNSIATDISNQCLIGLIKKNADAHDTMGYIEENYSGIVESYFSDLRTYSYRYSLSRTRHNEASEDIAQESIISLLKAENEIVYVKPWLRQVTTSLIMDYFKQLKKESQMVKALEAEFGYLDSLLKTSTPGDLSEELLNQVPEMATHPDYLTLKEMEGFPTLRDYAEAKEITYDAAKKKCQELRHNLRAFYLRMVNWEASPEILSFNEVRAVQKLIRQLIQHPQRGEKPVLRKNSSLMSREEIMKVFEGFETIEYWDIVQIGDKKYRLHIASRSEEKSILCSVVVVNISAKGRLMVESCKRNKLAAIFNIPQNVVIPKEKGKVNLSFEQIKALLGPENQINL